MEVVFCVRIETGSLKVFHWQGNPAIYWYIIAPASHEDVQCSSSSGCFHHI
jgi:hypothetical protein